MANERAWGAALQSLGGSVSDYYRQKSQEQVQAERDRKLAEAIIAREQRDIENKTLAQQLEGQTIMRREQPGVSYPLPPTPQQQLGPVALPAPAPYDYLGAITTPVTPARPATLSEIPGVVQSYYGRQEVPQDYYLTPKEPKPLTEYQAQSLQIRKDREVRIKKYSDYTRQIGLQGKLTDAQIAKIYSDVDEQYAMDFTLLVKLRQGSITPDEIEEMKSLAKLDMVREVSEIGAQARAGTLPKRPVEKIESKKTETIPEGTVKTVGGKTFIRSGGAWIQQ